MVAIGDDVELYDLDDDEGGPELNGKQGTVLEHSTSGCSDVLLWTGKLVNVFLDNIRKTTSKPTFFLEGRGDSHGGSSIPAKQQGDEPTTCNLRPGDIVEILGLESESGKAMNGHLGTVGQYHSEVGRAEVRLSLGKLVKLKPENLRKVAVKVGDHVEVFGLTSKAGSELNEKSGTITRVFEEKGRFEVRLGPYWLVSVRPDNLRRLDSLSIEPENFRTMMGELNVAYDGLEAAISAASFQPPPRAPGAEAETGASPSGRHDSRAFTTALRALQAPIFEKYAYPGGKKGADLMSADISRAVLAGDAEVARLYREITYKIGGSPVGEGRGDGGNFTQDTRARVLEKARTMAWRQLGQRIAAQGMAAVRSGALAAEGGCISAAEAEAALAEGGERSLDLLVRERLVAGLSARTYESVSSEVLTARPSLLGAPPSEWRHDWADRLLGANEVGQLVESGWLALERAIDPQLATAAGAELREHHLRGRLKQSFSPLNYGAKSCWLQWGSEEEKAHVRLCYPSLFEVATLLSGLPSALVANDASGLLAGLRVDTTVKVSTHEPGVRHGPHLDSYGGDSNFRMVTCLLYVNASDFSEADGGTLRIYTDMASEDASQRAPAPRSESEAPHKNVAPMAGNLVLFLSRRLWHEVLPATRDRYVMTLWIPGSQPSRADQSDS